MPHELFLLSEHNHALRVICPLAQHASRIHFTGHFKAPELLTGSIALPAARGLDSRNSRDILEFHGFRRSQMRSHSEMNGAKHSLLLTENVKSSNFDISSNFKHFCQLFFNLKASDQKSALHFFSYSVVLQNKICPVQNYEIFFCPCADLYPSKRVKNMKCQN